MRVLFMRLEAPMLAFGSEAIDQNGPTRDHPDASLLAGLIANALGYRRTEALRLQRLQDRLSFGVRLDRPGHELFDNQNARLFEDEKGWTTLGTPEGREKSPSYKPDRAGRRAITHRRLRYYRADVSLLVAISLTPEAETPTVDDIFAALNAPARPLFIGRKVCLPSMPLAIAVEDAASLRAGLAKIEPVDSAETYAHVLPPEEVVGLLPAETLYLTGRRDWTAGVHTGQERRFRVYLPFEPEATS